jgi:hypothetical protein
MSTDAVGTAIVARIIPVAAGSVDGSCDAVNNQGMDSCKGQTQLSKARRVSYHGGLTKSSEKRKARRHERRQQTGREHAPQIESTTKEGGPSQSAAAVQSVHSGEHDAANPAHRA